MSKFNKGDKVRAVSVDHVSTPKNGLIYTVAGYTEPNGIYVQLEEFMARSPHWNWSEDHFELVEPAAPTVTPHKHATLIKQWADNPKLEIQFQSKDGLRWCDAGTNPGWTADNYRIKPEPKPDIIQTALHKHGWMVWNGPHDNVKYIFDGETGELKSVELIK